MVLPIGIKILSSLFPGCKIKNTKTFYKLSILLLTFISYSSYHLSRRPFSVVKNVLHRNCSEVTQSPEDLNNTSWCNWAPFDDDNANFWFGFLDSLYLISYAIFMYIAGFVAERCNLRYFISGGMILCGVFTYLFGLAYDLNIHSMYYFAVIQIILGALQTTGWPAVFACVGRWFGPESSRGLIFGIWNSHAFVGNILGALISGAFVEYNWGLSFAVPAYITIAIGIIIFLFLVPYPEDVGLNSLNDIRKRKDSTTSEVNRQSAVSFLRALKIPGVIEFSICLFFSKLVSYTFLYWLPLYIHDSTLSSSSISAYLSTSFDIGGIFGAIIAGYIDDKTGASAITCVVMFIFTVPSLLLYEYIGPISDIWNIILLFIAGALVNGPYCLITTAVSAELGNKVDSNALATVSAIIDGTGSIGAAVGPFLAGFVSTSSWHSVFYMVITADVLALLSLLRITKHEWIRIKRNRAIKRTNIQ